MKTKIYLGKDVNGEALYLSKHRWDCNWYWSLGYLGNKDLHTHFSYLFLNPLVTDVKEAFSETKLTQANWWTILEMFQTAYYLQEVAELYSRGGSHIASNLCKEFLKDASKAAEVNAQLKVVSDTTWKYILEALEVEND